MGRWDGREFHGEVISRKTSVISSIAATVSEPATTVARLRGRSGIPTRVPVSGGAGAAGPG